MSSSTFSEIIGFFDLMFRRSRGDETILSPHETIFPLRCRYPETALGYQTDPTKRRIAGPGDSSMRTLSFILAFAFVLAGSSMAGSADSLPAAGAFAYYGAPAANATPLVFAAR
jgi:hypothetical protein